MSPFHHSRPNSLFHLPAHLVSSKHFTSPTYLSCLTSFIHITRFISPTTYLTLLILQMYPPSTPLLYSDTLQVITAFELITFHLRTLFSAHFNHTATNFFNPSFTLFFFLSLMLGIMHRNSFLPAAPSPPPSPPHLLPLPPLPISLHSSRLSLPLLPHSYDRYSSGLERLKKKKSDKR